MAREIANMMTTTIMPRPPDRWISSSTCWTYNWLSSLAPRETKWFCSSYMPSRVARMVYWLIHTRDTNRIRDKKAIHTAMALPNRFCRSSRSTKWKNSSPSTDQMTNRK